MRKKIIVCEHAVETLTYFSRQLADTFEEWGYEIFWMDFDMLGLSAWKLRQAMQGKEAVLVTFNFIGLSGEEELWELDDMGQPTISIWEKMDILCLNIMVDHPMYYFKALRFRLPQMRTFCVDRDHVSYMKRFYPGISCEFLPLAGNVLRDAQKPEEKPDESLEQWRKRPYPLVFTANYVPITNIDKRIRQMEPEYRDFYFEIIDAFLHNPKQDLLSCIETYLRREIPDLSDVQLCEGLSSMPAVDLWVRTYFREKTVRILAEGGVKVYLFGKDWELVSCSQPQNLVSVGHMVDSAACVQAMAQAQLALNTMPWFKDGAHDRIFTAMLQGTAALTDDSRYLREQYQHMDTILYYDLQNLEALPQQVAALLEEPERVYEIACRAKAVAQSSHRWKNRADRLKRYLS